MLVASVLMFVLTINSGDPLADLRQNTNANAQTLINNRISQMGLNDPWYTRYFHWLRGMGGCLTGQCDFGTNRSGQSVNHLLGSAAWTSLRLVFAATILAVVLGIFVGVMTAIRQYSGFDYTITFIAFALYSLPSFVFAVLLKEYGAIQFNNWLANPTIAVTTSVVLAAVIALATMALFGGSRKRRAITFGVMFVLGVAILQFFSASQWFLNPSLGWGFVAVVGAAAAVLFTSVFTGIANRRALYCALATAAISVVVYVVLQGMLWEPSWSLLFGLFALTAVIGAVLSFFFGGYARRSVIWISIWTSFSVFIAVILNFAASYWVDYVKLAGSRPIPTIGSETPNFTASEFFWMNFLDTFVHLLLPTISLTLMSFAAYTRYTRTAMLEVLGQDYIRTARSKGLPEHTVITRHAFRNAMIPITTIVASDFAGLIGGAVITETVFGWKGMGELFKTALSQVDPAPVMGFFVITGGAAIIMNMVADILYAYIDPRIRR